MEATLISFWAYTNSGLQRKYKKEVDRLFQSAQDVGLKTREYNKEWLIKTKEYHENPKNTIYSFMLFLLYDSSKLTGPQNSDQSATGKSFTEATSVHKTKKR